MTETKTLWQRFLMWKGKYFPERQLFLRSEGRVRFLTFSSNFQVFMATVLAGTAVWGMVTSYAYLSHDMVLAEKNEQISQLGNDYQSLSSDFSALEKEIERRAALLEQRHRFLEEMVGVDGEAAEVIPAADVSNPDESIKAEPKETGMLDSFFGENDVQIAGPSTQERRVALMNRLRQMEHDQRQLSNVILANIENQITEIDTVLADSDLNVEKLADKWTGNKVAMGGPYMPEQGFEPIFDAQDGVLFAKLFDEWQRLEMATNGLQSFPTGKPAADYYISSKFGRRRDPIKKTWARHPGLDMAGWPGTAILAAAPGKVVHAGWYGPYGNMVEIDHDNGFRTRYGHMRKLRVKKGQMVALGDRVGDMGKTGRVTGTHLHYEIWFDGKVRDPLPYMKASDDVLKIQEKRLAETTGFTEVGSED